MQKKEGGKASSSVEGIFFYTNVDLIYFLNLILVGSMFPKQISILCIKVYTSTPMWVVQRFNQGNPYSSCIPMRRQYGNMNFINNNKAVPTCICLILNYAKPQEVVSGNIDCLALQLFYIFIRRVRISQKKCNQKNLNNFANN